jgi:hypothetical protein
MPLDNAQENGKLGLTRSCEPKGLGASDRIQPSSQLTLRSEPDRQNDRNDGGCYERECEQRVY